MKLVIISGRSGSGKSSALHALEDEGFYCVDNLPASMLSQLPDTLKESHNESPKMAVSIDVRNLPGALENFHDLIKEIKDKNVECQVLYLDAGSDNLMKRYSSTRRKHPLSDGDTSLKEAIEVEKQLLAPVLAEANIHIDTSPMSVHEIRELVREQVCGRSSKNMTIMFQSFGFKHGVPSDADFIFDVRCLPNPFWVESLRSHTGLERPVQEFLENETDVKAMLHDISQFVEKWLPKFASGQRSYMTVAIGCTGGQHRSVYICKTLGDEFKNKLDQVQVRHRELPE